MLETTRSYTIALIGNPNCGKTSLFNQLTGARQRTGNMAGVTVTSREGQREWKGVDFHFVDLPGIYSLANSRVEETVARDYLSDTPPDLILNVLDANNLARNFALTTQLMEQGLPVVIALNMLDELEKQGHAVDLDELSRGLIKPVIGSDGRSNAHIPALLDLLLENIPQLIDAFLISYEPHLEEAVASLEATGLERWQALRWLESAGEGVALQSDEQARISNQALKLLSSRHDESPAEMVAEGRYGYIHGLLHKSSSEHQDQSAADHWLDRITLNRWLGMPVFVMLLWLMFEATFTLGSYPADWIDTAVGWIGGQVNGCLNLC